MCAPAKEERMSKTVINPPTLAKPTGYSYAIKKSGTPVFISGQVALDAEGKLVGENDAAAQTEQILKNLQAVVEGCGGTLDDVVKITIFVTDPSYRPAVAAARLKWFKEGQWPASTYLVVSALAVPTMLVEIEAVAMI
jgi:enamine deaminase RidA (YjgF/YER057c/UK114 family)